jgi:hypothetical protein
MEKRIELVFQDGIDANSAPAIELEFDSDNPAQYGQIWIRNTKADHEFFPITITKAEALKLVNALLEMVAYCRDQEAESA